MKGAAPTMAEVARVAGVARSTVSKALRDDPEIAAETRAKVQAAARQVGYQPNPLVTALMAQLRGRRRQTEHPAIGWLDTWDAGIEAVHSPTFDDYLEGARRRAAELGYHLERFAVPETEAGRRVLWKGLRHRRVGALLVPPVPAHRATLPGEWEHYAAAAIGFSLREPRLHRASAHYYQNMDLACARLSAQGYRRLGFCISERLDGRVAHAWQAEYSVYARSAPGLVPFLDRGAGAAAFHEWLAAARPDALLCLESWLFRPWLEALPPGAPRPPLFTLGYHASRPGLAGVDQLSYEIGRAAIDLIVAQLHRNERGLPRHPKTVLLEGLWRDGPTVPAALTGA